MSIDYQLMFAFHICMMILFMVGGLLSVRLELAITAALLGTALTVSILRRRAAGWRWRGASMKDVAFAILGVVFISFFLAAATPLASPSNPRMLPWFMGAAGLGLFGVLLRLNLVRYSEAAFLADCTDQPLLVEQAVESEPLWKRAVRWIYSVLFMVVWLSGVAFFYVQGRALRDGSQVPTSAQIAPLYYREETLYITEQTKQLIDILQTAASLGIPVILALGAILHFGLGIKIFGAFRDKN